MAKATSMRWYGHILRKQGENIIMKALKFEGRSSRGTGRRKQLRKKQTEEK